MYVGRSTSDGCRDFYFYAENGTLAETCLSMALVPFPEYEFQVGSRPDPEWSTYRKFLYPSPRAYQTIMNDRVLRSLSAGCGREASGTAVCGVAVGDAGFERLEAIFSTRGGLATGYSIAGTEYAETGLMAIDMRITAAT
jgi:hypothetical protein